MRIKAVIFDFDGVVVDSLGAHLAAWDAAVDAIFGEIIPADLRSTLAGRSTTAIATLLAAHFGKTQEANILADKKRRLLTEQGREILLLPGARTLMELLSGQNVPFGIASNAPRAFVADMVRIHQLHVQVALGVEDALRPKPAPDLFLNCAHRLGISHRDHAEVVVFEDSLHGLEAAAAAGMYAVGLMTQHPAKQLQGAGARSTFANLQDALDTAFFHGTLRMQ